jgi:hypothetical protein
MKPDVVNEFRSRLTAASIGKSCVRFSNPQQIDFATIAQMLRRTEETAPCSC